MRATGMELEDDMQGSWVLRQVPGSSDGKDTNRDEGWKVKHIFQTANTDSEPALPSYSLLSLGIAGL